MAAPLTATGEFAKQAEARLAASLSACFGWRRRTAGCLLTVAMDIAPDWLVRLV